MLLKLRAWIIRQYHYLLQIRDTPHAIAGGLALGVFFGFTPLFGLKTVIALLLAWLFRCSKLSAAIGVTFHDLLLFMWPLILRWQYIIGFAVLNHHLPPKLPIKHLKIDDLLHWKTLKLLWPIFIGSFIMALPLALLSYVIALQIVKRYQHRQATREPVTYS